MQPGVCLLHTPIACMQNIQTYDCHVAEAEVYPRREGVRIPPDSDRLT